MEKNISRLRIHPFEEKKVRKVTRTIVPVPIVNVTGKKIKIKKRERERERERERANKEREHEECSFHKLVSNPRVHNEKLCNAETEKKNLSSSFFFFSFISVHFGKTNVPLHNSFLIKPSYANFDGVT